MFKGRAFLKGKAPQQRKLMTPEMGRRRDRKTGGRGTPTASLLPQQRHNPAPHPTPSLSPTLISTLTPTLALTLPLSMRPNRPNRARRQMPSLGTLALLLPLVALAVFPGFATLVSASDPQDQLALLDVKRALLTSANAKMDLATHTLIEAELASWTPRTQPCEGARSGWARVGCDAQGRVTALNLTSAFLVGNIPADIGRLGALTSLLLSGNAFTGPLPSSLASLSALVELRGSLQEISGPLPEFLCNLTSLTALEFQGTQLQETIPSRISALSKLVELNLAANLLTGTLPDLSGMRLLNTLALSGNGLSGALPPWVGQMGELQFLGLRENRFEGHIPNLSGLTALKQLFLSLNALSGTLPDSLSALTRLEILFVSQNNLNGELPGGLSRLTRLKSVDLSANQFLTGPIPPSLGALASLASLSVSGCGFTGTLPDALSRLTSLKGLSLDYNAFVGSVPSTLGTIRTLTQLDLSSNTLDGTIPGSLCALTNLVSLNLGSNVINGTIPGCLVGLPQLTALVVSRNSLSGPVPSPVPARLRFSFELNCLTNAADQNQACAPAWYSYQAAPWLWAVLSLGAAIIAILGILALYSNRDKLGMNCACSFQFPRINFRLPQIDMPSFGGRGADATLSGEGGGWGGRAPEAPQGGRGRRGGGTTEFSLVEVEEATRSFTTLQGRDTYGNVYMGMGLLSGHGPQSYRVTVKRATNHEILDLPEREFRARAGALASVRHRYLVGIMGLCTSPQERILVYEFLPNGSLLKRLHNRDEPALTWSARVKIGASLACALEFLHCRCDPPLTHGAVSSANLLLAHDMTGKLADLGLHAGARGGLLEPRPGAPGAADPRRTWSGLGFSSSADSETGHRGSGAGGTGGLAGLDALGMSDPDGVIGGLAPPEKGDVYGFGVVLLELITGQRVMKDVHITTMARPFLDNPNVTQLMVDPQIGSLFNNSELMVLASVARSCIADDPLQRPSMKDVVRRMRDQMFLDPSLFQSEPDYSAASRRGEVAVSIPPTTFGQQRTRRAGGFEVLSPSEGPAATHTIASVDGAMYSIGIPRASSNNPLQNIGEAVAGAMPWNWGSNRRSFRG